MKKALLKILGCLLILGVILLVIWFFVTMSREYKAQQNQNEVTEETQQENLEEIPDLYPESEDTQEESTEETQQEVTHEVEFDSDSVIRIIPADEAGKVCVYFGDGSHTIYGETDSPWIVVDEATNKTLLIDDESFKMVEEESRRAFDDGRLHITFVDGQKRSVSY